MSTRRTRIIIQIRAIESQLAVANETMERLLGEGLQKVEVEDGDFRQETTGVRIDRMMEVVSKLQSRLDSLYRRLSGKAYMVKTSGHRWTRR